MTEHIQKHILLLDDSEGHLEDLALSLVAWGYRITACTNVESATAALRDNVHFAIVDLFLSGNEGDELSNGFVLSELMPKRIPFIRMSSAPGLVPKEFSGLGVYDKRAFRQDPAKFKIYLENRCK